jgi:hypothetical protein
MKVSLLCGEYHEGCFEACPSPDELVDAHKRKFSYYVKNGSGQISADGSISAARLVRGNLNERSSIARRRAVALLTKTYHGSRITDMCFRAGIHFAGNGVYQDIAARVVYQVRKAGDSDGTTRSRGILVQTLFRWT